MIDQKDGHRSWSVVLEYDSDEVLTHHAVHQYTSVLYMPRLNPSINQLVFIYSS